LGSESAPVHLQAGDVFMLPTGQAFRLYSDAEAEPVDAEALFSTFPAGEIAVFNGGGAVPASGAISISRGRMPTGCSRFCRPLSISAPKPISRRSVPQSSG
jgi:hypothetical protein